MVTRVLYFWRKKKYTGKPRSFPTFLKKWKFTWRRGHFSQKGEGGYFGQRPIIKEWYFVTTIVSKSKNVVKITLLTWPYFVKNQLNEWIYYCKFGLNTTEIYKNLSRLSIENERIRIVFFAKKSVKLLSWPIPWKIKRNCGYKIVNVLRKRQKWNIKANILL